MAFGKDTLILCPLKKYISLEMAYDANQIQNILTYDHQNKIFRYRKAEIVYKGKNHLHCFRVDSMHIWKSEMQELLTIDSGYDKSSSISEDQFIKGVHIENEDEFLSDNKLMHIVKEEDSRELDSFALVVDNSENFIVITDFDENRYSGVVAKSENDSYVRHILGE